NELHLTEEERTRGDEKPEAHPPQMTRDALCAAKRTSPNHPEVTDAREQSDGSQEQNHERGNALACMTRQLPDTVTIDQRQNSEYERKDHEQDIEPPPAPSHGLHCRCRSVDEIHHEQPAEYRLSLVGRDERCEDAGGDHHDREDNAALL